MVKVGRPARTSTSTVTRRGSRPSMVKVVTRASMAGHARPCGVTVEPLICTAERSPTHDPASRDRPCAELAQTMCHL